MYFLHDSVKTYAFQNDKKLCLLKKGIINFAQFASLIDKDDPYMLIGPAVVAKSSVKEFILEWKSKELNISEGRKADYPKVNFIQLLEKLDKLREVFPELEQTINEFEEELKTADCPKCVKKQFVGGLVKQVDELSKDGRDLGELAEFIEMLRLKYDSNESENEVDLFSKYDVEWVNPDSITGLGDDIIEGLDFCFDCVMKHLGRAKILYEEFLLGYPDHRDLAFDELWKGNKALEQAYLAYLNSTSELDMASCELVGNISDLPKSIAVEMIELANTMRAQRLVCQSDFTKVPDFDKLRIEVKKLALKYHKMNK